jgi:hypothetical protein
VTDVQELRTLLGTIIVLLIALVVACAGILRRQLGSEIWQKQREKPIDAMGAWVASHTKRRKRAIPEPAPPAFH